MPGPEQGQNHERVRERGGHQCWSVLRHNGGKEKPKCLGLAQGCTRSLPQYLSPCDLELSLCLRRSAAQLCVVLRNLPSANAHPICG